MKISKKIFQKSKGTHVSSINLKGKVSNSKNIDTALVYFCSYPYGTPCILEIYSKIYHDFKSRKLTWFSHRWHSAEPYLLMLKPIVQRTVCHLWLENINLNKIDASDVHTGCPIFYQVSSRDIFRIVLMSFETRNLQ